MCEPLLDEHGWTLMPFQVIHDTTRLALCSCTIEVSGPAEKSSWALNMSILSADGVAARRAQGAQFRG